MISRQDVLAPRPQPPLNLLPSHQNPRLDRASSTAVVFPTSCLATNPFRDRPRLLSSAASVRVPRRSGAHCIPRVSSVRTDDVTGAPGRAAVNAFIGAAAGIPFAPTLGDIGSTLSHPASSSHRGLGADERAALGIGEGMFRLSVGIEPVEILIDELDAALAAVRGD